MKQYLYSSRTQWAFFMVVVSIGYLDAAMVGPQYTTLKEQMDAQDRVATNFTGVKEIYIIPMPEVTTSEQEVIEKTRQAAQRAKEAAEARRLEELKAKAAGLPVPTPVAASPGL